MKILSRSLFFTQSSTDENFFVNILSLAILRYGLGMPS